MYLIYRPFAAWELEAIHRRSSHAPIYFWLHDAARFARRASLTPFGHTHQSYDRHRASRIQITTEISCLENRLYSLFAL